MGKTILLAGHPGSGRNAIIRKIAGKLGPERMGGFLMEEVLGPGGRHGMRLVTFDGYEAIISHKEFKGTRYQEFGRYGVDDGAITRVGVAAIQRAMDAGKIVIVDEIGWITLMCVPFNEIMMKVILGPHRMVGSIIAKPHPLADAIKVLGPVELREVNRTTKDDMHTKILKVLKA